MDKDKWIEENQDVICEYCKERFYDGSVNTNQYDLCEGVKCEDATKEFIEQTEAENVFRLEDIIRSTIKLNQQNRIIK